MPHTQPRRILIFSHAYYPRMVGGAEVAVKEITDRIATEEIEFEMITINAGGEEAEDIVGHVKVYRLFKKFGLLQKLLFPYVAAVKASRLHRDKPYDAMWCIMASYAGLAGAFFKRKHPSTPMILTIQEGDNFARREGVLKPLFKMIFASADRVTAISHFLADWARNMGARSPAEIVPNAVDFEVFSRDISPEEDRSVRSTLGFTENDVVLVTASRLVHKNAVDDVISSLLYLGQEVKLLVLGSGGDEKALRDLVMKNKLSDRVVFKGFVPNRDLPAYLHASDIFVRPSRTEGLGNSFLEAMATGIPVVATPVGGIPDFLVDGETGLFCEVDNPQSIAQKVDKLIKDKESRQYIVGRAREMVKQRYDWNQISLKMKAVLNK